MRHAIAMPGRILAALALLALAPLAASGEEPVRIGIVLPLSGQNGDYVKHYMAAGTELAVGKEVRVINGREYLFEQPLPADFAFIRAHRGDRLGNLGYRGTMRNFNMVMATAAKVVIAEVDELVAVGGMDPDDIHTPGIFVNHVVHIARHPRLLEIETRGEENLP